MSGESERPSCPIFTAPVLLFIRSVCLLGLTGFVALTASNALAAPKPKKERAPLPPTPADSVVKPGDFSGVYLDRFVTPPKGLKLNVEGEQKSRAYAGYYLGLLKEEAGDSEGAVFFYRKVLEEDPSAVALAQRTAHFAAQSGDIDGGLEILSTSLDRNRDDPWAYLSLSRYYATYVESDDALAESTRIAEEALKRFPANAPVIEHAVVTYVGFDEKEKAEALLEKALERESDNPGYWLRLGRIAQHVWRIPDPSKGAPSRVNEIYEKALALADDKPTVVEAVGDYYNASGQHERAIEVYEGLVKTNPDLITPREKLGRIYAIMDDFDKVTEVLSELLAAHPNRPATQKYLGSIYEQRAMDESLSLTPEERAELMEKAIDHYLTSLRLVRGDLEDYLHTAAIMLSVPGRAQDAIDLMERAKFHFPDNGTILRLLGIAYSFNKDYDEAVGAFEEALDNGAEGESLFLDDEFYYRYGACLERLKQFEKSETMLRKAMELVPEEKPTRGARIYNYLGYMWIERDVNIDEGGELIIKANELIPDDGAFIDSLGWFHFKKGRYEEALRQLQRSEELLGEEYLDAVVIDHIAQAHYKLGQFDEAIAYGERAAEMDAETPEYAERLQEYRDAKAGKKPASPEEKKDDAPAEEPEPKKVDLPPAA